MTLPVLSNLTSPAQMAPALLAEWFRPGASTTAHHVDNLFMVISVICTFFFVLIIALMLLFMWKYRARPGHREEHTSHHNNALEITWSVIPLILAIWIFFQGFVGYIAMRNAPANAYEIEVIAQKWSWSFYYPKEGITSAELHVPKDTPIKLILSSTDVIHSLYIPAFRVKMDCVPGRYNELWFEATVASDKVEDGKWDNDDQTENVYSDGSATYKDAAGVDGYDLFCTEYCGTGHSSMITKCVVYDAAGFEQWKKTASDPRAQGTPLEVGEKLYKRRGCAQCHSIDGTDNPGAGGPSFKGHYGEMVEFTNAEPHKMDAEYIRESILNPQAKIRKGYKPIMPTFQGQLNEDEIFALRQYIRSLNEEQPEDWAPKEGEEEGDTAESSEPAETSGAADAEEASDAEGAADAPEEPASDEESTQSET
ncbi:Cytochrome c oxidase subunit 2 precursor [Posidoniimonas polymericola]|uniref:Cytochrome c oxidase subunit 2 n=1 Tax=Posidoniimonas polymericola TaxID=2528002 RepID=A0A5C5YT93_9BACT|nr:cytochrome c oxidase subunit II [Posidoniimonas polymericola]TWT78199.1 Cytochrome c oxidase subunit 2 precursor [Posidoniimonas polymericola]